MCSGITKEATRAEVFQLGYIEFTHEVVRHLIWRWLRLILDLFKALLLSIENSFVCERIKAKYSLNTVHKAHNGEASPHCVFVNINWLDLLADIIES